jgi:hypothetical protein
MTGKQDCVALFGQRILYTPERGQPIKDRVIGYDFRPLGKKDGDYLIIDPDTPPHLTLTIPYRPERLEVLPCKRETAIA